MLESDGISDDISDWGSDFDDVEDEKRRPESLHYNPCSQITNEIYEIPDGKPAAVPVPTIVPEWLKKVTMRTEASDENVKPPPEVYIEHVLLPTRATKDEESKNFIESLKKKLSQRNILAGKICDPKSTSPADQLGDSTEFEVKIKKVKESLQKFPWFYRVDRSKAELILENYTADGSFLVRECHHGGPNVPFTLTIRFRGRLFHIQIRMRSDSRFALGTLKLNEMHFATIADMVDTYKKTHLQLHSNGKFFGETKLTHPPIVYSFSNKC